VARRFAFTLDRKGTLTPIHPLITEPVINRIGAIGVSPEGVTYLEAVIMGAATDAPVTLGLAGSASYHVANGERFVGFFPWKDGGVLTLRSDAATREIGTPSPQHKARFHLLGTKQRPVPKIPADVVHGDELAAYPDGRVLLVAAERPPKDDPMNVGPAFVLDFGSSGVDTPKRIALPTAEVSQTFVSAGRSPSELVVYETGNPSKKPSLSVLEGDAFVEIPLALDVLLPIMSLSRGDDGSLWLTTGYYGGNGWVRGGLYRVTIAGRHADVVRVRLPACEPISRCAELEPFEVLALSSDDVWLTASRGGTASELELLHTQASPAPAGVYVLDYDLLEREAWAEVVPPAYSAGCQSPLLVLGPASSLEEARVLEASRALGDFPANGAVRGRLGGERYWAIESWSLEGTKYRTAAGALAAWKKHIPSAQLVCASILVERTVALR